MWKGRTRGQGRAQRKNNLWAGWVDNSILKMVFQLWFSFLVQMQREYRQVKFDSRKGVEVD